MNFNKFSRNFLTQLYPNTFICGTKAGNLSRLGIVKGFGFGNHRKWTLAEVGASVRVFGTAAHVWRSSGGIRCSNTCQRTGNAGGRWNSAAPCPAIACRASPNSRHARLQLESLTLYVFGSHCIFTGRQYAKKLYP